MAAKEQRPMQRDRLRGQSEKTWGTREVYRVHVEGQVEKGGVLL